jgi:hypothetical protein
MKTIATIALIVKIACVLTAVVWITILLIKASKLIKALKSKK